MFLNSFFYVACTAGQSEENIFKLSNLNQQDIEDLDHYEMKEEEPVDGKKSEDDGIEKENLAILEKIRKNQRQDHLNVSQIQIQVFFEEVMGDNIFYLGPNSTPFCIVLLYLYICINGHIIYVYP